MFFHALFYRQQLRGEINLDSAADEFSRLHLT